MEDPDDHAFVDQLVAELKAVINNEEVDVDNQYSTLQKNQKALDLLDIIFYVAIGIMMFLCFFSL